MASRPVISASPAASTVTAHVTLGARAGKKAFGLAVRLDVKLPGIAKAKATAPAKKARVVCPYSCSIRKTEQVVTKIV